VRFRRAIESCNSGCGDLCILDTSRSQQLRPKLPESIFYSASLKSRATLPTILPFGQHLGCMSLREFVTFDEFFRFPQSCKAELRCSINERASIALGVEKASKFRVLLSSGVCEIAPGSRSLQLWGFALQKRNVNSKLTNRLATGLIAAQF